MAEFPSRGAGFSEIRVSVVGFVLALAATVALPVLADLVLRRLLWADRYTVVQAILIASICGLVALECRPWVIPIY